MRRHPIGVVRSCQPEGIILAPPRVEWALAVANRNFIIHQYDEINRELTWLTLAEDLPAWKASLEALFVEAEASMEPNDE